MQVHPPRSHNFNGSVPSFTSSSHSSYSSHMSSPQSTGRISGSRLRGAVKSYTHPNPPIDEGLYSSPSSSSALIAQSLTVTGTSTATASPTFSTDRDKVSSLHHIHTSQVKAKIKPVLKLMKENGRSSRNSLDLSKPGGGEAAKNLGLGIYGSDHYMYGYDDLDPTTPRGRRSFSGAGSGVSLAISTDAGGYTKSGQYIHPRRQLPRPYTPTAQHSDEHDSSSDEVDEFGSSRGYYSGEYSRGNSIDYGSRRAQGLRTRTDSMFSSPMLRTSTATNSSSTCSPITPINTSHTSSGLLRPSARRTHSDSGGTTREPSPSFAASVTAARLAWDAKEAYKEEKRERKRRRSEQKEREKAESRSSKDISRSVQPAWSEEMGEKVCLEEDSVPELKSLPYSQPAISGVNRGADRKRGVVGSSGGLQPTWTEEKPKGPGLKKRWLGFVVWIKFGLVKMGRKFGAMKSKVRKS